MLCDRSHLEKNRRRWISTFFPPLRKLGQLILTRGNSGICIQGHQFRKSRCSASELWPLITCLYHPTPLCDVSMKFGNSQTTKSHLKKFSTLCSLIKVKHSYTSANIFNVGENYALIVYWISKFISQTSRQLTEDTASAVWWYHTEKLHVIGGKQHNIGKNHQLTSEKANLLNALIHSNQF